jgi:hypothetical protein
MRPVEALKSLAPGEFESILPISRPPDVVVMYWSIL